MVTSCLNVCIQQDMVELTIIIIIIIIIIVKEQNVQNTAFCLSQSMCEFNANIVKT